MSSVLSQYQMEQIMNTLKWLRYNLSLLSVEDGEAFFDRMYEDVRNSGDVELVERVRMMDGLVKNGELTGDAYMSVMIMLLGTEYFRTNINRLINKRQCIAGILESA
jgi:hypothetical protein